MQSKQPPKVTAKSKWISIRSHDDRHVLLIRKASIESANRFTNGDIVHFTVRVRHKKNCIEISSTIYDVRHLDVFFRDLCE